MRRQNFYALPQAHWMMLAGPPFNYLETLENVDKCIRTNADLAEMIVKFGLQSLQVTDVGPNGELTLPPQWKDCARHADVDKARSTLRQFYRDWSAEGAAERSACYGPVKRALAQEKERRRTEGNPSSSRLDVLVPGAGLARLMFDLCLDGYDVEGNEISYHQLLASSYILNFCERAEQHTVHPWIHTFSNHKTRSNHLRGYKVPDVHCATEMSRAGAEVGNMAMTAADFLCYYQSRTETYDAVASVFFLDTAPNLIRYLQVLYHCLKPGGVLINVGPLLWHFENNPPGHHHHHDDDDDEGSAAGGGQKDSNGIADPGSFELSDDEVMALVEHIGFEIESRATGIEAPYIQDPDSMLQTVYRASSWVARRPVKENQYRA